MRCESDIFRRRDDHVRDDSTLQTTHPIRQHPFRDAPIAVNASAIMARVVDCF